MTSYSWNTATSGNWATPGLWTPAGPPDAVTADATIAVAGTYDVTIGATEAFSVDSLTMSDANAALSLLGTLTLGGVTQTLNLDAGTIVASGLISGGTVVVAGGTLDMAASLTYAGAFNANRGRVTLASGSTLTLTGAAGFDTTNAYGPTISGPGTLTTTGATTLATQVAGYADLYLAGGATWINSGTATIGGELYFGVTPADSASFVNQAGGVFNLTDDLASILAYTSYDTATFTNAGLLEKTAGTAISTIDATVTNTGSIVVDSGTMAFFGGGSFGGKISGAGTVAFSGGSSTLSATTATANFLVNGGTLAIKTNETVTGSFSGTGGAATEISLASGATLKLTTPSFATTNAYGPEISGPGTLSTAGATTLATQTAGYVDLYLAGKATWTNSGTATIGGEVEFGVVPADHAVFVNSATGVFDLTDDFASILAYTSYDTATFTNAGLLEKTAGTAISTIDATVTNTGSIVVDSGTMAFFGGGSFGGKISGAGTVAFSGGNSTLSATTTTANFLVNGGRLGVKTNETVSGSFSGTGGAATDISLASGMTLKLTGAASFDTTSAYGLDISGPGTLSTTGPTTLATQTGAYVDLYLSGGATWTDSGTATIGGQIDFGVVAADHASFVNQAGGVFNLIDDFAGIVAYTSYDTATFTNAGLLEKTAGTATSVIDATVTNTGSIAVASGTMAFFAGGSFGGTISGAGTIAFSGGTSTLSVATTTANLLVNGGTLNVSTNESISGLAISSGTLAIAAADSITVPSQFSGTGGLISLASGAKLAVTGTASFGSTNAYGSTISGPGTLSTTGPTPLTAQTGAYVDLYLAGGATWTNGGTATIGGQIDFGVTGADTAAFVNQAGAVFNLTDDFASIVPYTSYDTATFNNAGLLEKSGGTLISSIYATVTNTGSIAVASGTMAFFGGGSFGGSISGAGTVAFSGGTGTLTATTTTANFLLNGGTLAISKSETVTGPFSANSGLITLASAATLKLTAPSFDTTNAYGPEITGLGTLSTSGATTLATQSAAYVDLYLAGGATWTNSGTVTIGGQIDFGVTPADYAAFVNQAGGVFDLTDDLAGLVAYTSYDTATFSNAGRLEKTGGTVASTIDATVTNTGSIVAASGTMAFFGGGSFGGSISGAGTLAFSGGTSTLTATTTTANFLVNVGTLAIKTNETVTGSFSGTGSATEVTLASGETLKLTGAASFDTVNAYGPTISGPGTLSTTGPTTLATQGAAYVDLYIGNKATWTNSGSATIGGQIDFGMTPADHASFVNQAGGVFNLIDDFASFDPYTSYDTATFTNAGLLEKTGGTATSVISPTLTNTGTVLVNTGTLSLPVLTNVAGNTLTGGVFEAASGGVLELPNNVTIATDSATIILSGAGSAIQSLNTTTSTQVAIDSTLSSITAGGALRVLGGRSFTVVANGGNFSDSGQLQLGGGTLTATSLSVGTGAELLGYGTVANAVTSTGVVDANGGLLVLSSALAGASLLEADAGATLQLAANTALTTDSTKITLNGAGSEIEWGKTTPTKIESSLTTIGSTGTFAVLGNRGYTTTLAISDSGLLQLGGGTFAAASLTVTATGKLLGFGTVTPAVANSHIVEASGGVLKLSTGATGTGTLIADTGATLELAGATTAGAVTDNGTVKLDGITLTPSSVTIASGAHLSGFGTVTSGATNGGTIEASGGTLTITGAVTSAGTLQSDSGATLVLNGVANTATTGDRQRRAQSQHHSHPDGQRQPDRNRNVGGERRSRGPTSTARATASGALRTTAR